MENLLEPVDALAHDLSNGDLDTIMAEATQQLELSIATTTPSCAVCKQAIHSAPLACSGCKSTVHKRCYRVGECRCLKGEDAQLSGRELRMRNRSGTADEETLTKKAPKLEVLSPHKEAPPTQAPTPPTPQPDVKHRPEINHEMRQAVEEMIVRARVHATLTEMIKCLVEKNKEMDRQT